MTSSVINNCIAISNLMWRSVNMRTLKIALINGALFMLLILGLTLFPVVMRASSLPDQQRQPTSKKNALNIALFLSRTTSLAEMRQERNALMIAGLGLLVLGTALRTGRRIGGDQPAVTESLVEQSGLPLAS